MINGLMQEVRTENVPFLPYEETLRATLIRTGLIAVCLATFAILRGGALTPFPIGLWATLVLCILWFSFGGHWVEIFFVNYLRPRLPQARIVQIICRVAVWFIGGVALMACMRLTWELLRGTPAPWATAWWQGGVSFILVELIAHALRCRRGDCPVFIMDAVRTGFDFMRFRFLLLLLPLTIAAGVNAQATLTPEQCRADIAFAFETMEDVHPNLYAWTPKATLAKERAALEKSLTEPLTQKAFWFRFAPLVARLRDGHTWLPLTPVWLPYRDSGVALFPLDTSIRDGKLYVNANYSETPDPMPGAEITAINGLSTAKLLEGLMAFANEELLPARWNQIANSLRASLYLNFDVTAPFTVEYIPAGGASAKVIFPGVPWATLTTKRDAAQKATGGQTFYRYRFLPEDKIGLIEYERCVDLPKFEAFLKDTFAQIKKDKPVGLIIDVRKNAGGSGGLNEALCEYITNKPYRIFGKAEIKVSERVKKLQGRERYLQQFTEEAWEAKDGAILTQTVDYETPAPNPLRYSGPIYCLIGPGTFSNGMAFASAIKDCKIGVLIGEETGGVGSAYGDFVTFKLPNSGLDLNISAKHIFRPAETDDGRGILPDYTVKQTAKDAAAGRDTTLDFVKRLTPK